MTAELVTAPTGDVVALADLREFLRLDGNEEDYLIETLHDAAVAHLDGRSGILGRAILPQTWREEFTGWGDLRLSMPDVTSATVTYEDGAGAWQPATGTVRRDDLGWYVETDETAPTERIRVDYICAMPAGPLAVVRMIVKLLVAHWFENRGAAAGPTAEMPLAVEALAAPLRRGVA